jgi:hypothetical protein
MFDANNLLHTFYEDHVRLGRDRRDELGRRRDANLERVSRGLAKLGPLTGAETTDFESSIDQGSYKMHTLNQHPNKDYDIDTGLFFAAPTLPVSAAAARARIVAALQQSGGGFRRPPEARTNAVTVWYAEGYHVDLAIYRYGSRGVEHAGGDAWTEVDPEEFPQWFKKRNEANSPAKNQDQFRRIVRLLKAFAKSRDSWNLPGGMIISALADEVFCADRSRDDIALRKTLAALAQRLGKSTAVSNPVGGTLTGKPKYRERVENLRDNLEVVLPHLDVLDSRDCTLDDSKRAWRWIFNHSFWETPSRSPKAMIDNDEIEEFALSVDISAQERGTIIGPYRSGSVLPKDRHLRFRMQDRRASPYETIHWIVENTGGEAAEANDLGHTRQEDSVEAWRHTKYAGTHRMICEVRAGEVVIARGVATIEVM